VEQYEGQLFEYSRQKDAATRPWKDYAARARARGREIMTAFQEGEPNLTVFLTFGHTLPWVLSGHGRKPLPRPLRTPRALLDGLLDAATGRTHIVDGYELSYGFKDPLQFDDARRLFDTGVLPIVADPRRYRARMQLGFGLWLDYDWRRQGWSRADHSSNYFTPDQLGRSLSEALRASDEYVWVYSETPRWWGASLAREFPSRTSMLCARTARHGEERPGTTRRRLCCTLMLPWNSCARTNSRSRASGQATVRSPRA